ncbi:hypothetical protein BH23BAC3_BH23BAC3_08790 [soil metagenome]
MWQTLHVIKVFHQTEKHRNLQKDNHIQRHWGGVAQSQEKDGNFGSIGRNYNYIEQIYWR